MNVLKKFCKFLFSLVLTCSFCGVTVSAGNYFSSNKPRVTDASVAERGECVNKGTVLKKPTSIRVLDFPEEGILEIPIIVEVYTNFFPVINIKVSCESCPKCGYKYERNDIYEAIFHYLVKHENVGEEKAEKIAYSIYGMDIIF